LLNAANRDPSSLSLHSSDICGDRRAIGRKESCVGLGLQLDCWRTWWASGRAPRWPPAPRHSRSRSAGARRRRTRRR
jgi:hypothetical protein